MPEPTASLPDFLAALDRMERPLAVVAHQDDELMFSGLLSHCAPRMRIVWVTNGDGLYYEAKTSPEEYGRVRMAEALDAAAAVGIPAANTACLAFSEVEIYLRLMFVTNDRGAGTWTRPFFQKILDALRERLFAIRPDVVFTGAYQGGNPEHDLTHFFTRLALDDYERDTGRKVPFLHVPMYEYVVLVPLRFNPFYRGVRWRYALSGKEWENKQRHFEAYPSQREGFLKFRQVVRAVGMLGLLTRGKPWSVEEYMQVEEFGPVPEGWDYLRNPHRFDWANYIGDDFGKVPVSFESSVRPIVAAFPRAKRP